MNTRATSRKVRLILNGKVAGNNAVQNALARQRAVGYSIEVRVTRATGDARRLAAESGEVDVLIAAGGDGATERGGSGPNGISEVARPPLGVVPQGTANDFATGCEIPRDPEAR